MAAVGIKETCICGNEDPDQYRLHESESDRLLGKRCNVCSREWLAKEPEYHSDMTNGSASIAHESENRKMAAIGIEKPCICGNEDPDQYRLYESESGRLLGKRCNACSREWLANEPEYRTDVTNGSASIYDGSEVREMAAVGIKETCICGNEDPDQYRLHESESDRLLGKRCNVCSREWLAKEPEYHSDMTNGSASIYDESENRETAAIGIEEPCICGNEDPDQYRLYESESGRLLGKRCDVCSREWLANEPEYRSDVTNGSQPMYDGSENREMCICGNKDPGQYRLYESDSGRLLGKRCDECSREWLANEPEYRTDVTNGSQSIYDGSEVREMAAIGIEEPCICGNEDPGQYRLYKSESGRLLGKRCNVCSREWLAKVPEYHSDMTNGSDTDTQTDVTDSPEQSTQCLFKKNLLELKENTAFQVLGSKTKIDWKFDILKPGDHLAWNRKLGHWHHAILDEINEFGIVVIHWTKTRKGRIEIVREWLPEVEEDQDALYRLDYPDEITKENSKELVLARARSRIGDSKYGLLKDNCESLATYCKTGCEKSHQVIWLKAKMKEFLGEFSVTTVKILMKSGCKVAGSMTEKAMQQILKAVASSVSNAAEKATERIAEMIIQEFEKQLASAASSATTAGKITEEMIKKSWSYVASKAAKAVDKATMEITEEAVLELAGKFGGKVAFAETVEKVQRASNWVGAGIVLLLEGALVVRDLSRTYSERKNGNLTRRVYIEEATRRSVEGVSAAGLTVLFSLGPEAIGFLVGTPLGPLGTLFGGIIGGAIGCAVGRAVGTSAGNHLGRAISKRFQDDRAVKNISDLQPGDHVVLNCGGYLHPRCHAIVVKHDGKDHVKVIRNTYRKGVVEEWVEFSQPLYRVEYDGGACRDPEKVILYARLKGFEDYRYSLAKYNCKTFARECKTKSMVL